MEPGEPETGTVASEPGSFRDPSGRVFVIDGRVLRGLRGEAVEDWRALRESRFFTEAVAAGRLIGTREVEEPALGDWPVVVEHEPVPFVSYPYEWTFSMLKDAALLYLEVLAGALGDGFVVKDGTSFNVQFVGTRPVFIDVGSIERYRPGEPWVGYRQFCRQFLFPLMLRAYVGVPFQPWLRGDSEGPTPADMAALMSARDLARPGVATHVALQARFDRTTRRGIRGDLKSAGFKKEMIEANVAGLTRLVDKLEWEPAASAWTGYSEECSHVAAHRSAKAGFLRAMLEKVRPARVADLGANDGYFSELAAGSGALALAVDADEPTLEGVYRRLAGEGVERVQPVLVDLAAPSPGLGWAGTERRPFAERLAPDLVVAYAVVHHLVLARNVPLRMVLDWLAGLGAPVAFEWVGPDDPMSRELLTDRRAEDVHPDYREDALRSLLAERFQVGGEEPLDGGTRILFALHPRR
jgi:ribosomal protein L11 methylase PrmA